VPPRAAFRPCGTSEASRGDLILIELLAGHLQGGYNAQKVGL
jgi:hypothetical protein